MQYNFVDGPVKPKTVTVITPTIGSSKIKDAIESVFNQTYENVQHLVVVDGAQYLHKVPNYRSNKYKICVSPENTGANGFNGQRIYAAYPHLVSSDYIFFLDEDNWYADNHVETLVKTLEEGNEFAYSLREIYDEEKNYLCNDNCESLGRWPIWFTHENPQYMIDTSCFAFKKDFIQKTCHLWHSGPWGEDRRYYNAIRDNVKHDTNGLFSLRYRLNGNDKSVSKNFFDQGNKEQSKRYNNNFLWVKG